jgi:peroxiredoxin
MTNRHFSPADIGSLMVGASGAGEWMPNQRVGDNILQDFDHRPGVNFTVPGRPPSGGAAFSAARGAKSYPGSEMPEPAMPTLTPADAERLRLAFQRCRDMEGTLGEQLQAYAAAGRDIFPAYGEAVDRLVARIQASGGAENAPRPGEPMPPFLLPDETGSLVALSSLIAQGPVALIFFRGHWCPYCRLSVRAVIQAYDGIKAMGAEVVAIMPETQRFTRQFKSEAGMPFPVLTDLDNGYALSLNLAIWLGSEIQELLSYLDMAAFHGNDSWMLPIPATFIVGRDGLVKARFVDPDFRKRMAVEELLAALDSASRG